MLSEQNIREIMAAINSKYYLKGEIKTFAKNHPFITSIQVNKNNSWGAMFTEDYPQFYISRDEYSSTKLSPYPGCCSTAIISTLRHNSSGAELIKACEELAKITNYSYLLIQDIDSFNDFYIELGYKLIDTHKNKRTDYTISTFKKTI